MSPATAADAPRPARRPTQPFIADADMAPDDWLAILYLLGRPKAEFKLMDFMRSGAYYFWDPLTAAIATDEGLAIYKESLCSSSSR